VESEHWRVDVNVADFDEVLEPPKNVQHVAALSCLPLPHVNHIPPHTHTHTHTHTSVCASG
jgi:hypothetical protein